MHATPAREGVIEAAWIAVKHGQPMQARDEVQALEDRGLEDCRHARRRSKRQILVCGRTSLDAFQLSSGQLKENLTVAGLDVDQLPVGTQLACGEALLEIVAPCEPCTAMDAIRPGLKEALANRRGMLCRVLQGGRIRRGDSIRVVEPSDGSSQANA